MFTPAFSAFRIKVFGYVPTCPHGAAAVVHCTISKPFSPLHGSSLNFLLFLFSILFFRMSSCLKVQVIAYVAFDESFHHDVEPFLTPRKRADVL